MQFSSLCAAALSVSNLRHKIFQLLSINVWFLQVLCKHVKVQHMHMCVVWPWVYWEWTESLPEIQLYCDLQDSVSRRKVTCEGCRALHDDKHDIYQINFMENNKWQRAINTVAGVGRGFTGQCVLHPIEAYNIFLNCRYVLRIWAYMFHWVIRLFSLVEGVVINFWSGFTFSSNRKKCMINFVQTNTEGHVPVRILPKRGHRFPSIRLGLTDGRILNTSLSPFASMTDSANSQT